MTGAANRMQGLLDALLRDSRVETKGEEFRPVRLNDLVKDAAADLEMQSGMPEYAWKSTSCRS